MGLPGGWGDHLREPITVTKRGEAVGVFLATGYLEMQDPSYLYSTPANVERIRKGLLDYEAGRLVEGELCD